MGFNWVALRCQGIDMGNGGKDGIGSIELVCIRTEIFAWRGAFGGQRVETLLNESHISTAKVHINNYMDNIHPSLLTL